MKLIGLILTLMAASCTNMEEMTEAKVLVISSLNSCYELSLRNAPAISEIQEETGYRNITIPEEWKPIYAEQAKMVRGVPWKCDLWFSNPDYVDEVKLLLK